MRDLKIRLTRGREDFDKVLRIRETVFIEGQKVPREREIDGLDKESRHVIVFYRSKPIGCARVRFMHGKAKLERIALLEQYRSKGAGKELMKYLIQYCKRKKVREIVLHSQEYVKEFYEKLGFRPRGKTFVDAGINHVEMYMKV